MIFRMFFNGLLICSLPLLFATTAVTAELPTRTEQVPRINVVDLKVLQAQESVLFIDTRTAGEWQRAADKVTGAIRVASQPELDRLLRDVPPHTAIVTYCS